MICRAEEAPAVSRDLEAIVCWMAEAPLRARGRYVIKHTTRSARALVDEVAYRVNVNTLRHDDSATELGLNDIGRVRLRTGEPLVVDRYTRNRTTGSFILIDEATNDTVGAGSSAAPSATLAPRAGAPPLEGYPPPRRGACRTPQPPPKGEHPYGRESTAEGKGGGGRGAPRRQRPEKTQSKTARTTRTPEARGRRRPKKGDKTKKKEKTKRGRGGGGGGAPPRALTE